MTEETKPGNNKNSNIPWVGVWIAVGLIGLLFVVFGSWRLLTRRRPAVTTKLLEEDSLKGKMAVKEDKVVENAPVGFFCPVISLETSPIPSDSSLVSLINQKRQIVLDANENLRLQKERFASILGMVLKQPEIFNEMFKYLMELDNLLPKLDFTWMLDVNETPLDETMMNFINTDQTIGETIKSLNNLIVCYKYRAGSMNPLDYTIFRACVDLVAESDKLIEFISSQIFYDFQIEIRRVIFGRFFYDELYELSEGELVALSDKIESYSGSKNKNTVNLIKNLINVLLDVNKLENNFLAEIEEGETTFRVNKVLHEYISILSTGVSSFALPGHVAGVKSEDAQMKYKEYTKNDYIKEGGHFIGMHSR